MTAGSKRTASEMGATTPTPTTDAFPGTDTQSQPTPVELPASKVRRRVGEALWLGSLFAAPIAVIVWAAL